MDVREAVWAAQSKLRDFWRAHQKACRRLEACIESVELARRWPSDPDYDAAREAEPKDYVTIALGDGTPEIRPAPWPNRLAWLAEAVIELRATYDAAMEALGRLPDTLFDPPDTPPVDRLSARVRLWLNMCHGLFEWCWSDEASDWPDVRPLFYHDRIMEHAKRDDSEYWALDKRLTRGLLSLPASEQRPKLTPAKADEADGGKKKKQKRATINMRMMEVLQENREAMGWSSVKWAKHLECSRSTITETATWKNLEKARYDLKAQRMADGKRRRTPKRSDTEAAKDMQDK